MPLPKNPIKIHAAAFRIEFDAKIRRKHTQTKNKPTHTQSPKYT